jgi:hypothetical protein
VFGGKAVTFDLDAERATSASFLSWSYRSPTAVAACPWD